MHRLWQKFFYFTQRCLDLGLEDASHQFSGTKVRVRRLCVRFTRMKVSSVARWHQCRSISTSTRTLYGVGRARKASNVIGWSGFRSGLCKQMNAGHERHFTLVENKVRLHQTVEERSTGGKYARKQRGPAMGASMARALHTHPSPCNAVLQSSADAILLPMLKIQNPNHC